MQKIGSVANTLADSNGEFTDGNVAGGVPPAILPAKWFNTIQRELINVLVAAGITPDSKKFDQVAKAISTLVDKGEFLKIKNNLSEIKAAGPSAVAAAIANLGLKEAAKRDVGTGANQIPDMTSFDGARGVSWMKKHPSGLIECGGSFGVNGSTSAQIITVNYPVPFPSFCTGIWFSFQTADPSARFCGVFDKSSSLTSFIASVITPSVNTIYYRAVGY